MSTAPTPAGTTQPPPAAASPTDRPEVMVGAALAGGFLLAKLLGRLAR